GRVAPAAALPLFADEAAADALSAALPVRFSLELAPNDTLEQVRRKERDLEALGDPTSGLARWKEAADLWCACWFSDLLRRLPPAAYHALTDIVLGLPSALRDHHADAYLQEARSIAAARRWFHWELEFPEVFFDADGSRRASPVGPGFDAVTGNPPWEMMRADTGAQADRRRVRDEIATARRFARHAGTFSSQSDGHVNYYQLFVDRAIDLTRSGGRIGLVVPAGLAADHGGAGLRRKLLSRCDVDALVGVDNHRGIFPIHRSVRFLLMTATAGAPTRTIPCRFGVEAPAD